MESRSEHSDQVCGRQKPQDVQQDIPVPVIGVPGCWELIERDHARILELLGQAGVVAAQSRQPVSFVLSAYEAVIRKFEEHFANEEGWMARTRFPEADAHRRHHQVLLIRLLSIRERMRTEQAVEIDQLQLAFQSLLDDAIGADAPLRLHLEQSVDAGPARELQSGSGLERD